MIGYALKMLSTYGLGTALKEAAARRFRNAAIIAAAGVLLFIAVIFGLVACYNGLHEAGFSGAQSAGLVAGGLVLASILVLAIVPMINRRQRSQLSQAVMAEGPAGAVGVLDEQVGRVVQQVGPLGILATAFAIGVVAGRR